MCITMNYKNTIQYVATVTMYCEIYNCAMNYPVWRNTLYELLDLKLTYWSTTHIYTHTLENAHSPLILIDGNITEEKNK